MKNLKLFTRIAIVSLTWSKLVSLLVMLSSQRIIPNPRDHLPLFWCDRVTQTLLRRNHMAQGTKTRSSVTSRKSKILSAEGETKKLLTYSLIFSRILCFSFSTDGGYSYLACILYMSCMLWCMICDGVWYVMVYVMWWCMLCDGVCYAMMYDMWRCMLCDGVCCVMVYSVWGIFEDFLGRVSAPCNQERLWINTILLKQSIFIKRKLLLQILVN
jgi:hypothetical protein